MILALDIETTGLNWQSDRIVEVAAILIDGGEVIGGAHHIINPGEPIPTAASDIHGITTERAVAEGKDPAEALGAVATAWDLALKSGTTVVAYNAKFDIPFLLAEFARHGINVTGLPNIFDPLVVDKHIDRYRRGSRKLVDVAKVYGVTLAEDDAHSALADATAAGLLAEKLLAQLTHKPGTGLFLAQMRWAEQQRQSFVDYRRQQGDLAFDIPAGWPIPSGVAA